MMHRRTKIIATLGPATDSEEAISAMIDAGVDLVRLNFSHGSIDEHKKLVESVRKISREKHYSVGILGDLQGAKIRIAAFKEGKIVLRPGDTFKLDGELGLYEGTQEVVGFAYKNLLNDVGPSDSLLIDDGRIVLDIDSIEGSVITTTVVVGGEVSSCKGINRKGGGLSAAALTEKDIEDIKHAAELDLDYLAVSFLKDANDIAHARELLHAAGSNAGVIAKIERAEALEVIDEILENSEAIMIARGDLGVEIGDANVPGVQKWLIEKARNTYCVVITATQMMESMNHNPIPTRAEVSDVANAVLDGTDAVMLSSETAIGKYPIETVKAMSRICRASEKQELELHSKPVDSRFGRVDQAIAMAAMYLANHLDVAAIATLTESGSTALWMSRISSEIPIYALTRHIKTRQRVTLYKGVFPAHIDFLGKTHAEVNRAALDVLQACKEVEKEDLVILTKGDLMGVDGGTNAMKVLRVGHTIEETGIFKH